MSRPTREELQRVLAFVDEFGGEPSKLLAIELRAQLEDVADLVKAAREAKEALAKAEEALNETGIGWDMHYAKDLLEEALKPFEGS